MLTVLTLGLALGAVSLNAADTNQVANSPADLENLSLQQLVNVQVTSVSKKEENLLDAAAAVSVLSNDDLRRSGATSVAEALRLVPGLNVASFNASDLSISARGFSGLYADNLLVLVDGRAVYSPIFSGVFWDLQQMDLEDVDRIEVIRGPGATVWGANAVNGVINIVSKSARDTQGGYLYTSGGTVGLTADGVRYGGKLADNTYYRFDLGYQLTDDYPLANGQSAGDGWQSEQYGYRLDNYSGANTHLTWQAGAVVNQLDDHTSDAYNANTLARWTQELSDRSSVEVQTYFDRTYRDDLVRIRDLVDTFDLTAQHTFGLGENNDVIWGAGYRFTVMSLERINQVFGAPANSLNQQLFSAFAQDEFKLVPDKLTLTAGAKIEHNDFTGFEVQPSIRASFKPAPNQTLWTAVSRAVTTPDPVNENPGMSFAIGAPFRGPGGGLYLPEVVGNKNIESQELLAYELGYRLQAGKRVQADLAAYYNQYDRIIGFNAADATFVPGLPLGTAQVPWANLQRGHTDGGEATVTVAPLDSWRLTAGYSLVLTDIPGNQSFVSAPQQQATLRSSFDFSRRVSLDGDLRYVDQLAGISSLGIAGTPSYLTADARLAYRPTDRVELSIAGQNLFAPRQPEPAYPVPGSIYSQVPRGFYAKMAWHF
jgi:iron complex outermembrane receptor protein